MVEQLTLNQLVEGSSPSRCTNSFTTIAARAALFVAGRGCRVGDILGSAGIAGRGRKSGPDRVADVRGRVAELVDALDLGSSGETRQSSNLCVPQDIALVFQSFSLVRPRLASGRPACGRRLAMASIAKQRAFLGAGALAVYTGRDRSSLAGPHSALGECLVVRADLFSWDQCRGLTAQFGDDTNEVAGDAAEGLVHRHLTGK